MGYGKWLGEIEVLGVLERYDWVVVLNLCDLDWGLLEFG